MDLYYQQHAFEFRPDTGATFQGRLVLAAGQREVLTALLAAEKDDWYLDDAGRRLPAGRLFELSPWSCVTPSGPIQLLCRFLNLHSGEARFSTPETYLEGGLFDWL